MVWIFKLWSDVTLNGGLDVKNGDIISKMVCQDKVLENVLMRKSNLTKERPLV